MTAVLNARLIGMIDRLVSACERHLAAIGIDAPLMVVRGDGALISAALALPAAAQTTPAPEAAPAAPAATSEAQVPAPAEPGPPEPDAVAAR